MLFNANLCNHIFFQEVIIKVHSFKSLVVVIVLICNIPSRIKGSLFRN